MHIILQCIVLAIFTITTHSQSCLNTSGKEVDWWFILKMPLNSTQKWTGLEYFYCDSVNNCKEFNLQDDELSSSTSPLMSTIKQINFEDNNFVNMLWSDQPIKGTTYSSNAHSKGIMSAKLDGDKNAFIISHSTPRFPKLDDSGKIADDVHENFPKYGQHFLCLSTTSDDINDVLAQMYYQAEIVIYKVGSTPRSKLFNKDNYKELDKLWYSKQSGKIGKQEPYRHRTPYHSHNIFTTRGNQEFSVFSQNQKYNQDIYSQLIVKTFNQNLIMETWVRKPHGSGLEDAVCNTYETLSNKKVSFSGKNKSKAIKFEYSYTKDHSKYGITFIKEAPSTSRGGSFIATDYSHPSLKGQIFVSGKNRSKRSLEQEDIYQWEEDAGGKTSFDMHVHPEPAATKRKADHDESHSPIKKRATDKNKPYVCLSDLNRQQSQWTRGGVVYCFQNEYLWKHLDKAFVERQDCDS
ncbi:unnamed protein product [Paramecium octaurelia]|uniref:Uncharacterized protein n=1 Tax=Paramecium octaurelia TaxID=43137 RepID=A0A8S1UBA0_PAROT|nr:unnamed protein product [Paramecium octaurelia]